MQDMKNEFSKLIVVIAVIVAVANNIMYWITVLLGFTPDSSVPVTALGTIFGAILSYCLYQLGLKNSRNKYGIDSDGQPFMEENTDEENL
jgi:hypothetical protein